MTLSIVLKLLGGAAGLWLFCFSLACHAPRQETGLTGLLVDEQEREIPLFSYVFLSHPQWSGNAEPVKGISELLICIHYDTVKDGSGHVLSLRSHAPDVRVELSRRGCTRALRQGDDTLLENGDRVTVAQNETVHCYRYERKTIYPRRKEEESWLR